MKSFKFVGVHMSVGDVCGPGGEGTTKTVLPQEAAPGSSIRSLVTFCCTVEDRKKLQRVVGAQLPPLRLQKKVSSIIKATVALMGSPNSLQMCQMKN